MLSEMERLYIEEKLSLGAVGKILGVSRQAVHDRLRRAGIERRQYTVPENKRFQQAKNKCDVAELVRRYVREKKSILELSRTTGINYQTLRTILTDEGVAIRPRGSQTERRYPQIYELKVGESVIVDLAGLKSPYSVNARISRRMKARFAMKRVKNAVYRFKRLT